MADKFAGRAVYIGDNPALAGFWGTARRNPEYTEADIAETPQLAFILFKLDEDVTDWRVQKTSLAYEDNRDDVEGF